MPNTIVAASPNEHPSDLTAADDEIRLGRPIAPKAVHSLIDWEHLEKYSTPPAVKIGVYAMISIPVFAYVLGTLDEIIDKIRTWELTVDIITGEWLKAFVLVIKKVFSSKLRLGETMIVLYWASVSLAMGNFFHWIFCPPLIRSHKIFTDYLTHIAMLTGSIAKIRRYRVLSAGGLAELEAFNHIEAQKKKNPQQFQNMTPEDVNGIVCRLKEAYTKQAQIEAANAMSEYVAAAPSVWAIQNMSLAGVRRLIAICYAGSLFASIYLVFWIAPSRVCKVSSCPDVSYDFFKKHISHIFNSFQDAIGFVLR